MKKFKNSFGVTGSATQIAAFKEAAEVLGWRMQYNDTAGTTTLFFNGSSDNQGRRDLKKGCYWFSSPAATFSDAPFILPEQWSEAIQAASEVEYENDMALLACEQSSLIPFDLEKALNGAKVVTEDRTEITDLHEYNGRIYGLRRLTALSWDKQGNYLNGAADHPLDLFLLPEEKVCYRNVYPDPKADGLNCTTLAECDTIKRKEALCVLAFTTIGDRTTVSIAHTY